MENTNLESRITINPDICNGKPIVRNLRISVRTILEYLAAGETAENILDAYPILEAADIKACLEFSDKTVDLQIYNLAKTG